MNNFLRLVSIFLIVLSIVFFLYASAKTAESSEQIEEIDLGDGIVMVDETPAGQENEEFANYGFITASILGISGVLLLFISRKKVS